MRPPILTQRQFDVLELIAVGATRTEMAKELGISPETVKLHVKAVLEKFGATNVRDGMFAMNQYITAYGKNGYGKKLYYETVELNVNVSESFDMVSVEHLSRAQVLFEPVTELGIWLSSKSVIKELKLNGKNPDASSEMGGFVYYQVNCIPALSKGEIFDFNFSYKALSAENPYYQYSLTTGTPTGRNEIYIQVDTNEFLEFQCFRTRGAKISNSDDCPEISCAVTNKGFKAVSVHPYLDDKLTIKWHMV